MNDTNCLIYFDLEYKLTFGHWTNMANNLSNLCKKSGYKFIHLTNNKIDIAQIISQMDTRDAKQLSIQEIKDNDNNDLNQIAQEIKDNDNNDLNQIVQEINSKKIIFYSYYFEDIQNFTRINNLANEWPNILFYINYLPNTEKIIATDINYLKKLSDYPNFYVLADTDNLYYYLASRLTLNVRYCPCHIMPLQTPIINKNPITSICYYYNKQANANAITSLVKYICPQYGIKINIKLRANLKNLNLHAIHKHVNLIRDFQDNEKYYAFLASNNIIILNYDHPYYYRSSGVFIEALYFRKIVITIQNTWMGKVLQLLDCGAVYPRGNITQLISTVREVLDNLENYQKKVDECYQTFLGLFDSSKLFSLNIPL